MAVGESLVLSVTDPNGATNTLQTIINSGGTYLYEIINPVVGEHLLTLTSTNVSISFFKKKLEDVSQIVGIHIKDVKGE